MKIQTMQRSIARPATATTPRAFGRTFVWALTALVGGCAAPTASSPPTNPPPSTPASHHPFDVTLSDHAFDQNPKLLSRLRGSPHGYFRFINQAFSQEVCRALEAKGVASPAVNLHGDAHLEQYAVTDLGRGLTDFDDAVIGPAPVDLLRFGVSLSLATQQWGWQGHTDQLVRRFLEGYRTALKTPDVQAPTPAAAARIRGGFRADRMSYLNWVDSISAAMMTETKAPIRSALRPYVETMRTENPDLRPGFFDVVDIRRLQMGIGSALDDKFLVRIAGGTSQPEDDVILELKEVRDLSGIPCLQTSTQDPFRILVAQSRIAYRPYRFLGYVRIAQQTFWIHAWVDNYKELKIGSTARTPDELAEVVYDVGVQLGRGHPNQIAAPLGRQLRQALSAMIDEHEMAILDAVRRLADEVYAAWSRFPGALTQDDASTGVD